MKKKAKRVLASLARPVLVYATNRIETASADLTVTASEYRHMECGACHTEVAFASGGNGTEDMYAMCPECGGLLSDHEAAPTIELDPITDDSLTAVQCKGCGTHNVFEDETLDKLDGTVHCSVCASALQYTTVLSSDDGDTVDLDAIDPAKPDEDTTVVDETPDDDDDTPPEEQEATLSPSVASPETDLDNGVPPGTENPKSIDSDDKAIGVAPKGTTQAIHEEDIGRQLLAGDDGSDEVEMPLDDMVDEDEDISLIADEENARILACVAGVPCMTLAKADSVNPERFHERSFRRALLQQASADGLAGLRREGFKPILVKAPIGRIVTARLAALVGEERKKVQASVDTLTEDMTQSLQLAAVAIAKGFKNARNPLADRLVATLKGVGVSSASKLITREMAASGLEYARAVIELAEEYRLKSNDFRNELAEALSDAGSMFDSSDDEDSDSTVIESRVTAAVKPAGRTSAPVVASVDGIDARAALQRVRELSTQKRR